MKAMPRWLRSTFRVVLVATTHAGFVEAMAQDDPKVAVEAVRRLNRTDVAGRQELLTEFSRVADRVTGTPMMVELGTDFDLRDRLPDVVDYVRRNRADNAFQIALRWVGQATRIVTSLQRPEARHGAAVRAPLGSELGSLELVGTSGGTALPDRLRQQIVTGLKSPRFGNVRKRTRALVRRKDALFDAVVDPGGGISFGYEAWLPTTREGEEVLGLLARGCDEELAPKVQGGQVVRVRTVDVIRKANKAQPHMPDGVLDGQSAQEVTDLLSYLETLKVPMDSSSARE